MPRLLRQTLAEGEVSSLMEFPRERNSRQEERKPGHHHSPHHPYLLNVIFKRKVCPVILLGLAHCGQVGRFLVPPGTIQHRRKQDFNC